MTAVAVIAYLAVTAVFALAAAWVGRRLLDGQVGWLRAGITGGAVFVAASPVVAWALERAGVVAEGRLVVAGPLAVLFLVLTVGWVFAAVVGTIVTLEFLWPSRPVTGPVALVRDILARRDRSRRYAQIIAIASRHGLGLYRRGRDGAAAGFPSALVAAMNEAGVTFVKLGQLLSSREDVLPPELTSALATLQMASTPIPWEEARAAIETELGRPVPEVFADIDEEPLAAASVAQVHAATLRGGRRVVVKIQRPAARAQVQTDLDILTRLAQDAERRTEWGREYGAVALAEEFGRALREELDYRVEAANTEMLRGAVARSGRDGLRVPEIIEEFTTARMIVQDLAEGIPFSNLDPTALEAAAARRVAGGLLDTVFDLIAIRGVFHADLHPGNLILGSDGSVALIDFGAVGVLEKSVRRLLVPLLVAIANEDDAAATDLVLLLVAAPELRPEAQARLQHDIGAILTRVHNTRLDKDVFPQIIDVLRRHRMPVPPPLLLVARTLAGFEGSLHRVAPDYDMVGEALARAPYYLVRGTTLRGLVMSAQTQAAIATEQLRLLPRRMNTLSRQLESGTFSLRMRGFQDAAERRWIETLTSQLTTTLVGIALVVTAVLLVVSDGGPMLTADVALYPFAGSAVGLAGALLLLRSLRIAFSRRRGDVT